MTPHELPLFSFCIPTYRGLDRLPNVIRSLNASLANCHSFPYETIVLDDGTPEDGHLQRLRDACRDAFDGIVPSCFRLGQASNNLGVVAAYNVLVSSSRGKFVFLLDDDVTVPKELVATAVGLATSLPGLGVLSWRSLGNQPGQSSKPIPGMLQPATQLAGYCMMFPRAVFDELEGFDSRNFRHYCGDSDFALRATLAGHPCYRVWWPLVAHTEHAAFVAGPELERKKWINCDLSAWEQKWRASGPTMEATALARLHDKATTR